MNSFEDFLRARLAAGGFTTEDTLASFLPLLRQTIEAHGEGKVAPLEGLADLRVDGVRIWFEESRELTPKLNQATIRKFERENRSAIEVVREARVEVGAGGDQIIDLRIGRRDEEVRRPVYFPGYVSWEHLVGHHDPLTDVFSLGLILASLACGLDLSDDADIHAFVEHRGNLFALQEGLHPVLARAIARMTELDRHRRPQDLSALLGALENYRDQDVEFDLELARVADFPRRDLQGKQQVVVSKLQERLFEISRNNRLLHFRPTMNTVNLTHASTPLSFDVRSIRPERILVWNDDFQKRVASGKPLCLNHLLNFHEAIYLPSLLDHIRLEAGRDKNEYGFAQLRLVACFLRWSNLKESPPVEFESPLVLVPVELTKKKGVEDTFHLQALDSAAEINPVVRHLFNQLYGIDLPETFDLEQSSLDDLHAFLVRGIEASTPAVNLAKIDRPRIDLIHDKAKLRLDQYRRRSRLSGRGVRRFLDVDYSYDPANFRPLGLQLFNELIRPAPTRLEVIMGATVRRQFAVPETDPPAAEKQQTLYHLREGGEGNPYAWELDLCSVTLGNFKYRKMSLVRDYQALLQSNPLNPAFDATFSLSPRPVDRGPATTPLELKERYHVVACDATQQSAIAEARTGNSYIIQGPPGTGKSQTITNLIADYAARGKRVLFVCEKRAAIDVVYHRLSKSGLNRLCCLIHDSQADKKEFVMDLKQTYEELLADSATENQAEKDRERVLRSLERELLPLATNQQVMSSRPEFVGASVRELLERLIELRGLIPETSARERERVPPFAHCHAGRDRLKRFAERLGAVQADGILARYPLRLLNQAVLDAERPIEHVTECLPPATASLEELIDALSAAMPLDDNCDSLAQSLDVIHHAADAEFLAARKLMALVKPKSKEAEEFAKKKRKFSKLRSELESKQAAAKHWKEKLAASDVPLALEQARQFEGDWLRFFKPGWWKLRSILNRSYDFKAHQVPPTYVQALEWLQAEHAADQAAQAADSEFAGQHGLDSTFADFLDRVAAFAQSVASRPDHVQAAHRQLLDSGDADARIVTLARSAPVAERLPRMLDRFLTDYENLAPAKLHELLNEAEDAVDELPDFLEAARELAELAPEVASALRANEWTAEQLEAVAAQGSFEQVLRKDRGFAAFTGPALSQQGLKLDRLSTEWLGANARSLCDRVRSRFLEHVKISTLPADQLTPEQKPFKKDYSRGRRELEHEFGKTMRYKPIRDLVAGESGLVVKDLKPIWLMSPLSVSDTLPLDTDHFDVVIFDEASQILLEEAVPSLFRATQTIVVGDEMQLPPTNFFSARHSDEDGQLAIEEDGEVVEYDLESNSFLNHAARNLSSCMLGWHYRSRSESLISFSNWAFYGGRLLTAPDRELASATRPELTAAMASDAAANAAELLKRPVSFHFIKNGVYQKRRNQAEADYIAELVRNLLQAESHPTIGIVAFSEAQQDEILTALQRLAERHPDFRERLEAEFEREEENQFAGLLVKNLENIQGDERDVVIMSVCYAPDLSGKMRMNFGPINQSGGEKRLNVAFSRAKRNMALVSSIRSSAITNDYNDGANCLRNYLQYAESCSSGNSAAAERTLHALALARTSGDNSRAVRNAVVDQLCGEFERHGFIVDRAVGQSQFRCDLAVRREGEQSYRLGILVDTEEYYSQSDLLERDLMRPNLLRAFGWRVAFVLSKDWWQDAGTVFSRLLKFAESDREVSELESSESLDADATESRAEASPTNDDKPRSKRKEKRR